MKKIIPLVLLMLASAGTAHAACRITSSSATGDVGVAFPSYTITISGCNSCNVTGYGATGLPPGLTVNTSTGLISGTPTTTGTYSVTLSVTFSNCATITQPVTFTINNPVPTTTSINPTCAAAGGPQFTLTVNGTNFISTSTVKWNGTALATTYVSSTQLTATVPAALIATAGMASVTVVNPGPGGGTSNSQTFTIAATPVITSPPTACGTVGVSFSYTITATNNPTSFTASALPAGLTANTSTGVISGTPTAVGTTNVTITASNGASPCNTASATLVITISARPTISSLNPTCVTVGGPQFTLTVNGTNYVSTSTVNWNGTPLATTYVSSTQLTATVPAALIATAGTASITVVNPTCAGATSTPATFTIAATPVITSPLTACGTVGLAFSYTIAATNNPISFAASPLPAGLSVNTSTGVISGTPTTAGTTNVTITASNGASPCNAGSAVLVISISSRPTISSLNPTCTTAGGPQFMLTVNGTNYVSASTVNWNGNPLATTFVSATRLTATVPSSLIATAGTASITVVTPDPCGGVTSSPATFTIADPPVITSPPTACGTIGVAFSYTITATNNPTSFTASPLPAGLSVNTSTGVISGTPTAAGTTNVTVTASNGATPCNTSAQQTLVITIGAAPSITSLNPNCAVAGGPQFTLTVNGTNFVSGSTVKWNGTALTTTFVSSTQLTATVPASLIATPGTASITVVTPCGGTSNAVTFTINASPTITSTNPTCATAGGPQFTLTVNGTNYVSVSTVNWNGTPLATTFVSATQLRATVPAALIATAGTASVTVVTTNACGTATSNAVTFAIVNTPVITSPLTACGTVGSPFSYTITATNNPTSFSASPLPAGLSVNASTGVISGTPTSAGTTNVTITASNGAGTCNTASAILVITISSRPTITSLNPTCTAAGGPQFTLTVNGTNFVSGSTVNWNGSPLATAFVSATQLTATVPAALIATAGTASITVVSPCGGTSTAQTFTIANTPVITNPPPPPNNTACGTRGVAFSYTITATNNPTSFSASPLPAGLTVNTSTGVISGTPTTTGTTSVTISASNGAGPCNTATATLVITIGNSPTISSISPTCTGAGGPQFTLTVNGPNNDFTQGDTVYWDGNPLVTTFVNSRQLTATVPAALIATPGTAAITVGGCGATSGAATFTISATPTISSLSPTCAAAGDPQFALTVNGTNFVSTSIVNWNGAALTTTFVSSTQLTATVSAARIANPGTASVTVVSPCGATSNAVTFPIEDAPSITSALTATATVGSAFTYQITANNNPISYDASGLPGGLTVDTTTGLISGTPTATGTFPVTITATNDPNDPCGGTATDTLQLTVSFPGGVFIPPFQGQENVFNWGSTPPPPGATIPFPNASTNNNFILYWNPPGTNTHPTLADSANGGLQRNADPVGMQQNYYDPSVPGARPDPTKNVWRGNPIPPNDNTSGQFGDPRASWYISDPWPTADYVTGSYWAGPNPNVVPLNWPDSGHPFSYNGLQPTGKGQYPTDIMASPTPAPVAAKSISLLSDPFRPNAGNLDSITELANVWDPAQLSYTVAYPGSALPDIPNTATRSTRGAGGHTLAIGRPEFSMFDQNGMRAWQLLDVFSGKTASTNFTNTAGLVNLNTASRDVLRSLAVGILQTSDPAIQPSSLLPPPNGTGLYPPTATGASTQQADLFADAVINSRPLLSTAALSAIRDSQGQPFFGNPNQYNGSTQTPPTEWNDTGREELFSKIYNLATTRSRNFRVFVTGQSLDKNGRVLSTVTKVYHVFIKPTRDATTGAIQTDATGAPIQQVQIKYEGSM